MSAVMSVAQVILLPYFFISLVTAGEYVPVKVEIETNEGGVPPEVFTAQDLLKYDASDVSFDFVYLILNAFG